MKKFYLLAVLISLITANSNAQFIDDMESYTDGEPISGGHWTDWGCGGGPGCALMSSSFQAHSGFLSGLIPDDTTTDAVLDLGNRIFGEWCLRFYMYIPSGKEAFWVIKGGIPISTSPDVGMVLFNFNNENHGIGSVEDIALGEVTFNFPHDEWFRVKMYCDISGGISLATWFLDIDGVEVVPNGTAFTNQGGDIPGSLGGIEFFSISGFNSYYLDDFDFSEVDGDGYPCFTIFDIEDIRDNEFEIYPNPVSDALYLQAKQEMTSISIRNILGQEVYSSDMDALNYRVDVSNFSTGTYFVKVTVGKETVTKKFIKE